MHGEPPSCTYRSMGSCSHPSSPVNILRSDANPSSAERVDDAEESVLYTLENPPEDAKNVAHAEVLQNPVWLVLRVMAVALTCAFAVTMTFVLHPHRIAEQLGLIEPFRAV